MPSSFGARERDYQRNRNDAAGDHRRICRSYLYLPEQSVAVCDTGEISTKRGLRWFSCPVKRRERF